MPPAYQRRAYSDPRYAEQFRLGQCPPDPGRRRDPDRYTTERVKRMVGKVLTGITRYDQGAYDLVGGEELSDAEREELLRLCRQRLDAFRMQRGEEVGCLLTQKLRLRAQEPPPHPYQRLNQSPGAHPCQGPMRMLRGGLWVLSVGGQRPGAAGERIGSCASPMPIR